MSQDTVEKAPSVSLKSLLQRLKEIHGILSVPEDQLEFLATASADDKKETDDGPEAQNATLDALSFQIDRIARMSNHIAKSANIVVGN